MFFDSPIYLIFLGLVVAAYWCLSWRKQNVLLLFASYVFYGWWDWRFLLLMLTSTCVDYALALKLANASGLKLRRALLFVSLALNFGCLGFFKYCNFFFDSFVHLANVVGFHNLPLAFLNIVLPPAISFYTFQEVAYIVDVYQGKQEPARSLIDYALFISLFPHLIAGPIQRPSHLLGQVQHPRLFDARRFFDGLMLIASGLFRKCVIADGCAVLANAAFAGQLGHNCWATCIGIFAFAWQIYGDFSGYSDLARGSAQLLGFHFVVNFRQPYLAESLQDFWHRWHISLSTWLRDYLYIPLGGSRRGEGRTYVNLMTTMLLGGLWHGANWTFVVWGAIHGVWLSLERLVSTALPSAGARIWRSISRPVTLAVVAAGWLFFRATSLHDAVAMFADLTSLEWRAQYGPALLYLLLLAGLLLAVDLRLEYAQEEYLFQRLGHVQPLCTALTLCVIIAAFGAMESSAFIYFQF